MDVVSYLNVIFRWRDMQNSMIDRKLLFIVHLNVDVISLKSVLEDMFASIFNNIHRLIIDIFYFWRHALIIHIIWILKLYRDQLYNIQMNKDEILFQL